MNACKTEGRRWRTVKAVVTATFPLRKARSSCANWLRHKLISMLCDVIIKDVHMPVF